jgi:hypothetical protein
MKVVQKTDYSLLVKSDDLAFAGLFFVCFIVFAVLAAVQYFSYPGAFHSESFQGAVGAALTGLVGFLALFERSTFVFDRGLRVVRWQRQRALRRRSGVVQTTG